MLNKGMTFNLSGGQKQKLLNFGHFFTLPAPVWSTPLLAQVLHIQRSNYVETQITRHCQVQLKMRIIKQRFQEFRSLAVECVKNWPIFSQKFRC